MFTKIEQPDMLRKIIGQIKQNIAEGRLQKGDRLPSERQMVEMFGLSRATIREALKALEMLGLIDCAHGSGNYISSNLSHSLSEPLSIMFMLENGSVEQTYQLRRSLEFSTAGLAATQADGQSIANMRQLCRLIESSQVEAQKALHDRRLHMEIARASKNPLLVTLLNACEELLSEHIRDAREQIVKSLHNDSQINAQHRALVDAIEAHDPAAAEQAILQHMELIATNTFGAEARE